MELWSRGCRQGRKDAKFTKLSTLIFKRCFIAKNVSYSLEEEGTLSARLIAYETDGL